MLDDEALHLPEFVRREIRGLNERDRLEPEFRERAIALYVDVGWFVAFVTEEEEAIRTDAKDGRQSPLTISTSAASVASPLQRAVRQQAPRDPAHVEPEREA